MNSRDLVDVVGSAVAGGPDAAWDGVALVAASTASAPVALLTFPTRTPRWLLTARFGTEATVLDGPWPVLEHVVRTGQVVAVVDGDALAGGGLPFGLTSLVAAPVRLDAVVAGCLVVLDPRARAFDGRQVAALEALACVASGLLRERVLAAEARADLLSLRRQLERSDRLATVGRLGAGIAHELGTPLAVVAGRARQLASGMVPPEQSAAAARTIAEQADRMTAIIRQLLDFARRRGPRLGRFDARTLLRQAHSLLEPVAHRKSVRLELDELPEVRIAQFDGSQMLQVLSNLVMNAVHATPAGGVVRLALGEGEATPPSETGLPVGRYVQLRVSDTGVGIAAENLQHVFEPFFTTKDTGEGTGLGLTVAQGIVRDHEGWISVESNRGQGSSFIVHLPG